ncbi:MAG: hypothetical protein JW862_10170, partial [Anaerolineales bacterium]|nr:hypothetical protein [Anaerolineales bacterium]
MSHLAIFALGPLRIELNGRPLETSRHKALALLVYLAMRPVKQSREALSALLWPDYQQEKAYAYLRRTLWELKSLLGEGWLEADRETIGLHPSASVHLDVMEFQLHLAALSRATQPAPAGLQECAAHLHSAALLYRGDFLAGFSLRDSTGYEDWQLFEREALRREYASALQKLVNRLYGHGDVTELMPFALRWLALDPLNEEAQRLLMKSYTVDGQRHLAVQQYHDCARLLQSELGVKPESETCLLYEAILSGAFPGKSKPHPAAEPAPTRRLPSPATSFIGRQHELDEIGRLLVDPRCWLITLLGPGGIGKTRLAVEAGARQASQFAQGCCLVSLSVIESERSIAPAIARALELTFRQNGPAPEEQLLDFLREKRLLLILDSFEQLIQWAGLLEEIHTRAP